MAVNSLHSPVCGGGDTHVFGGAGAELHSAKVDCRSSANNAIRVTGHVNDEKWAKVVATDDMGTETGQK